MKTVLLAASAATLAMTPMASQASDTVAAAAPAAAAASIYPFLPPPPDPSFLFRKPARNAIIYYNQYGSMQGYDVEYCDGTTESLRDGPGQIQSSQYYEWLCFDGDDPLGGF